MNNEYVKKLIIAKKSIAPIITESKQTKQPGIYLFERTGIQDARQRLDGGCDRSYFAGSVYGKGLID